MAKTLELLGWSRFGIPECIIGDDLIDVEETGAIDNACELDNDIGKGWVHLRTQTLTTLAVIDPEYIFF